MSEFVVVSDPRPAVRVIAISRPEKKNALTRAMYDALAAALRAADADRNVRVICLTGTGDAFTAGNDIADFRSGPPPISNEVGPGGFIAAVAGMEKPVIAAANGLAVGIGTTILERAEALAAKPARVVRLIKRLITTPATSVPDRAEEELRLLAEQLDAPEAKEAMQAFLERRRPDFSRFA